MKPIAHDCSIHIAGTGNVGGALADHFVRQDELCEILPTGWESDPPKKGCLFLALPDDEVERVLREIYPVVPPGLRITHFAGGLQVVHDRVHLLHPFASVNRATDLSRILCLWVGRNDTSFRRFLTEHRFRFIHRTALPGLGYHTAAVIAGNFTQYLYAAGLELLEREGFSEKEADALLEQLVASSISGVRTHGIAGLTGPAVRGDTAVVKAETAFLAKRSAPLSAIYRELSKLIATAVRDGEILP
ncbi:MAG TPA: DUF2520 domain-containing protein [bacterium]|nr:DUF2520 domain-containing protein [bacterium]